MIPTSKHCISLMETYGMLDNIKAHSIMVERVANLIARGLIKSGENISLEMVTAGALMHDIGKSICLNSTLDHAQKGKEICTENNLPEIAGMVEEHIHLFNYAPDGRINEKEIIYYSDKRVNHDKIVSLNDRMKYIFERYAMDKPELKKRIEENFEMCRSVEKKLFSHLDFKPEDIGILVKQIHNTIP